MKNARSTSFVLLLLGICAAFAAKKEHYAIFNSNVYTINQEVDVVLELTPDQIVKLDEAREVWQNNEKVRETNLAFKLVDGEKSEEANAAKKAFYEAQKEARAIYDKALEGILTEKQKALVTALNDFAKEMRAQAPKAEGYHENNRAYREYAIPQLPGVLSPEQLKLLDAASAVAPQ